MRLLFFHIIIFILFPSCFLCGQVTGIDSLILGYKSAPHDTDKVNALDALASSLFMAGDYEACRPWSDTLLLFAERVNDSAAIAKAKVIKGGTYQFVGLYSAGLQYYFEALVIREAMHDQAGTAQINLRLGQCYSNLGDLDLGFEYENKALVMYTALNDKRGTAQACNALGGTLMDMKRYDDALKYYYESLRLRILLGDSRAVGQGYNNIGLLFYQSGKTDSAIVNYTKALKIKLENGDTTSAASSLNNIALIYIDVPQYDSVILYATQALTIAEKSGNLDIMKSAHSYLSAAYEARGNYQLALYHEQQYELYRDSIFNENNTRESINAKVQYEFDKKQAVSDAEFKAQIERRNIILVATGIGALLLVVFSIFIYSRLRVIRGQKKIIEQQKIVSDEQKALIEEKNKEILDSILYARRLQEAILPPIEMVRAHLPDSFVLYLPKDIVAGDFYWMEQAGGTVLFAAADCTGHGVPGAMVSVVCSDALNRAVKEFGLTDPGKILDKVRELVLQTFERSASAVNDGMDIGLVAISPQHSGKIQFAGANRPLLVIRKGAGSIEEIPGNKQPVGRSEQAIAFHTTTVALNAGDSIYLLTDGFADQFGGNKGKKLKNKALHELLVQHADQPMEKQQLALTDFFSRWKGGLEQVDDVLIAGIRI